METCLLCLEVNRDNDKDYIEANSPLWKSLNITTILEQHFWPLETLSTNSWLCSSCWEKLEDFHNFYLHVEEAHMVFVTMKTEETPEVLESKGEIVHKEDNEQTLSKLEVEIVTDPNTLQILKNEGTLNRKIEATKKNREVIDFTEDVEESDINETIVDTYIECDAMENIDNDSDITENSPTDINETIDEIENNNETIEPRDENISEVNENIEISTSDLELMEQELNDSKIESDLEEDFDINNSVDCQQDKSLPENCKFLDSRNSQEDDEYIEKHMKEILCDLCETKLEDFNAMKRHFHTVHNQKGYIQCCYKKYYHRGHLADHLRWHLNPEFFKCLQCGKNLSDRSNLRNHIIRVHRPSNVDFKYACDKCDKSFAQEFLLRLHKVLHEGTEEDFPCTYCGKFFRNAAFLKRHVNIVHLRKNEKICDICGQTCSTATGYKSHMRKHEHDPVKCPVCGLRLKNQHCLKRHLKVQHPEGGKKPYPCSLCKHVAYTAKTLRNHVYYMHEKSYDHKCTICEKAFKTSKALREHLATHTGDKLYTCNFCPKAYNSFSNLVSHRKKLHSKEWEEEKRRKYY
ncbi:uncharacterized protein ACRADG_011658 [Cochliomyia hominivorax]